MFVDPAKCGSNDMMVFASENHRLAYKEVRHVYASFKNGWRPTDFDGVENVPAKSSGTWTSLELVTMDMISSNKITVASVENKNANPIKLTPGSYKNPIQVAACAIPPSAAPLVPALSCTAADRNEGWQTLNLNRSKRVFDSISWLTTRLHIPEQCQTWQPFDLTEDILTSEPGSSPNEVCAPSPPETQFAIIRNRLVIREDPEQAGPYEQALKRLPKHFVVQLRHE